MDISQIADIIDDYADDKKYRQFGELLCNNFDESQIITYVQSKIHTSDFMKIWKHIIFGLSYFQEKSLNIIKATLKHADEEETTPISRVNELLNYIINVLPRYKTENLVNLVKFCLTGFQNMNTNRLSWKDIFPDIVNILVGRESIEFEGQCLSGKEFEKEVINSLCALQWEPSKLAVIISIFCDLPLNKEDHLKVLNKIGSYTDTLTPQEVPSFVYQLLILCKNQNFISIVIMLQQYFGLRLYEQNEKSVDSVDDDSESREVDILEEAELSVFFHIKKLVSTDSYAIRDYLNFIRTLNKAPEFLLHPFHLKVLLVVYEVEDHKDKVWELLKSLLLRYHSEKCRRETSIRFSQMSSKLTDLESIINVLINSKTSKYITESLVDFCLRLLNVKSALPHVVDSNVLKLWDLGQTIIIKIFSKSTKHARSILNKILQSMRASHNKDAHIKCLIACKEVVLLALMMNQIFIQEIMEDLQQIPGSSAILFLDIVIPLTKLRTNIKDQTILFFRKSLYCSKTETRKMAVAGFLKLLTNIDIKNVESLSQMSNSMSSSSSSGPSLFTQLSLPRSQTQGFFSDEALSWEILSILKRCFMQKLEVRNQLYKGLVQTAFENEKLGVPILEVLWSQISKYYVIEEETLPPLDFSRLSITRDTDVIQQESFGKLLYVIGMVLVQIQDDDFPSTIEKFQKLMDSICERMITCELVHFELDDGTDLSDVLPECKEKVIILQEAMRVYEALIAYKIKSWNKTSSDNGSKIVSLFQSYSRLLHFAKNIGKSKKGRKKKDDTNVSQKSSALFKVPKTIMDVSVLHKALQLLHEPTVEWTTMVEANVVRSNKELHRYFFQSTRQIFADAKNKKNKRYFEVSEIKPAEAFRIASIIFTRCVKTLDNYKDFDCVSAVEAVECFEVILSSISPFRDDNKDTFDPFKDEESPLYVWNVMKTYQKLLEDQEDLCEDPEMKKLPSLLLSTQIFLSTLIPSDISSSVIAFYDWMIQYAKDQTLTVKSSATLFFTLLFNMHLKYKLDSSLFQIMISSIGNVLGRTIEIEEGGECFKIVNELSLNSAFTCTINAIKSLLDDVEMILAKLKCEHTFRTHVPAFNRTKSWTLTATAVRCKRQSLSEKEASVSELLYVIAKLLGDLTVVVIPPGALTELLLRSIIQIYSMLVNFTKYFGSLSSSANAAIRGARFEELVKFVGTNLTHSINVFILHLEEEDKKIRTSPTKKKSADGSSRKQEILKNTRCIPKSVYVMEQFSKCVMQLSNKTKIDLYKHIGTGTTRDFRILVNELDIPERDDENEESVTNEENTMEDENQEESNMDDESQEDDVIEESGEEDKQDGDIESSDNPSDEDLGKNESTFPPLKKFKS